MSDADSTRAYLETLNELEVSGISFWTYNGVSPATWQMVRKWLVCEILANYDMSIEIM